MDDRLQVPWHFERAYFQTPSTSRNQSQDRSNKSSGEKSYQPEDSDALGDEQHVPRHPWTLPPLDSEPKRRCSLCKDRDNEMPTRDGSRRSRLQKKPSVRVPAGHQHDGSKALKAPKRSTSKPNDKIFALYSFATTWEKLALVIAVLCAIANGVALPLMTVSCPTLSRSRVSQGGR